jgi:hypothetical protein
MSAASRIFVALLLLGIVTIEFGGQFLLSVLRGREPKVERGSLTYSLFRAGHAHAGVLVILAIVAMPYVDLLTVGDTLKMVIRVCFAAAPLLVSGGMFGAGRLGPDGKPGSLVKLVYVGGLVLAAGLGLLGVNLLLV